MKTLEQALSTFVETHRTFELQVTLLRYNRTHYSNSGQTTFQVLLNWIII